MISTSQTELAPGVILRRAERPDMPTVLGLIKALAEFEKLPPPDAEAEQRLIGDAFGDRPRFEAWLAMTVDGSPVGYAILFETYSTFLARPTLFLEDLFVVPEFRQRGIGTAMFNRFIRMAFERGCGRMEWSCLNWNVQAQSFYEKLGARRLSEWMVYRLGRDEMSARAVAK